MRAMGHQLERSLGVLLILYVISVYREHTGLSDDVKVTTKNSMVREFLSSTPSNKPSSQISHEKKVISVNGTDYYEVCLDEACLNEVARRLARPFSIRPKETWCVPTLEQRQLSFEAINEYTDGPSFYNNEWRGLLLVKVPKAASSTCAGVILRIANQTKCAAQWEHREGYKYQNRSQSKQFLVGSIRQPGERAFSNVWFFQLSPLNITPTDENVIRAMNTRRGGKTIGKGGYQYNYLSIERVPRKTAWDAIHSELIMNSPHLLYNKIRQLIATYHFMIVVERMDESLTALSFILGIDVSSVLVPSAKVATGDRQRPSNSSKFYQVRVGRKKGQCIQPRKEPMSVGVRAYLNSPEWLAMNYADELLHRAAHASLNRTIDEVIGRSRFDLALLEYQRLKTHVERFCGPTLGTGCTKDGTPITELCYDRDFGCGYPCIDRAVRKYREQKTLKIE